MSEASLPMIVLRRPPAETPSRVGQQADDARRAARPVAFVIIAEVADARGLTTAEMLTSNIRGGLNRISHARQEAMWRMRRETSMSMTAIARRLNLSNHTTVLHGVRRHQQRLDAQAADCAGVGAVSESAVTRKY